MLRCMKLFVLPWLGLSFQPFFFPSFCLGFASFFMGDDVWRSLSCPPGCKLYIICDILFWYQFPYLSSCRLSFSKPARGFVLVWPLPISAQFFSSFGFAFPSSYLPYPSSFCLFKHLSSSHAK